ncbi:ABC transporter permease [Arthrobacter sp. zg-Y820]|uniref:ABC transporter permease n=1 Tax=unclassified Arthrobacter TaxID=235627 RepID=UPI001E4B2284|nr:MULTISPECIES: ABC transporter permease [unclassified Arthrobacter]MCC9196133.1 ABC transporter permease [Arthrobacter sp. zg-Y820]MDK1278992.1 ABC transporter permease [Arthrobacter sp. zg.Y820]WIB08595.1 ABC transporter permease [Arthrobacter sp. zg-Y820]
MKTPLRLPAGPLLGMAGIAGFLLTWELIPRTGLVNPAYLPPASDILGIFFSNLALGAFWTAVGQTMTGWALGLLIAATAAVILGLIIGSSTFLRRATNSTIEFLRPIPSVALIPLAVLLFGFKLESTLLLVVYASFWQVLIQVLYGVADVDPVASNTARSFGLGRLDRIRYVVWPTTLPYLMTGIRLAAAVALILAITAGLIIGSPGLGNEIALAQSGGAVAQMYALVLTTGVLGIVINMGMRFVERRTLRWHSSVRGDVVV